MSLSTVGLCVAVPILDEDAEDLQNVIVADENQQEQFNLDSDENRGFLLSLLYEVYEVIYEMFCVGSSSNSTNVLRPSRPTRRYRMDPSVPGRIRRRNGPLPDIIQSSTPPSSPRDLRSFHIPPPDDLSTSQILPPSDELVYRRLEMNVQHIEEVKIRWRTSRSAPPPIPSYGIPPQPQNVVMLRSSRQQMQQWAQLGRVLNRVAEEFESHAERRREKKRNMFYFTGLFSAVTLPTSFYIWSSVIFYVWYHFLKEK